MTILTREIVINEAIIMLHYSCCLHLLFIDLRLLTTLNIVFVYKYSVINLVSDKSNFYTKPKYYEKEIRL